MGPGFPANFWDLNPAQWKFVSQTSHDGTSETPRQRPPPFSMVNLSVCFSAEEMTPPCVQNVEVTLERSLLCGFPIADVDQEKLAPIGSL